MDIDVVIVGGGPAGLSAALILGRCRRRVLLCDTNTGRNAMSHGLHGYLTRDGVPPAEFRKIGIAELARYENIMQRDIEVIGARPGPPGYHVALADGSHVHCRRLLLATGVTDALPPIPGFAELYGHSVFHCPYCDGWEMRDEKLVAFGAGESGAELALKLTRWSAHVTLCTHGPSGLSEAERARLSRHGIVVREEPIARLDADGFVLREIVFEGASPIACRGLFFTTGRYPQSNLPAALGCTFDQTGCVKTGKYQVTGVPNLYVAGDAAGSIQMVIIAAAEGAAAAVAINTALQEEETQ